MANSNINLLPIIVKHFSTSIASSEKCYINLFIIILLLFNTFLHTASI